MHQTTVPGLSPGGQPQTQDAKSIATLSRHTRQNKRKRRTNSNNTPLYEDAGTFRHEIPVHTRRSVSPRCPAESCPRIKSRLHSPARPLFPECSTISVRTAANAQTLFHGVLSRNTHFNAIPAPHFFFSEHAIQQTNTRRSSTRKAFDTVHSERRSNPLERTSMTLGSECKAHGGKCAFEFLQSAQTNPATISPQKNLPDDTGFPLTDAPAQHKAGDGFILQKTHPEILSGKPFSGRGLSPCTTNAGTR